MCSMAWSQMPHLCQLPKCHKSRCAVFCCLRQVCDAVQSDTLPGTNRDRESSWNADDCNTFIACALTCHFLECGSAPSLRGIVRTTAHFHGSLLCTLSRKISLYSCRSASNFASSGVAKDRPAAIAGLSATCSSMHMTK